MAKGKLEDQIEAIRLLRHSPATPDAILQLRKALQDRNNLIVAEAAKTAAALHSVSLIPDMLEAYDRLFQSAMKSDPKCWGKTAIIQALTALDYSDSPPFVRGSTYVQMEPVWGSHEDAAGALRSNCILALPQCTDLRRIDILTRLVDALFDPLDPVRIEAVRTLEQMNGDEALLLLRFKARAGDTRPAVTGCAFDAMLQLGGEQGLAFVAEFLKSKDDETRDEAALAIGSRRDPEAVRILITVWNDTIDHAFRSTLLRAISASREETALEFLLSLVTDGSSTDSAGALEALAFHSESADIATRIESAKNCRKRMGKV